MNTTIKNHSTGREMTFRRLDSGRIEVSGSGVDPYWGTSLYLDEDQAVKMLWARIRWMGYAAE